MAQSYAFYSYPDGNSALYLEGSLTDEIAEYIVRKQVNRLVVVQYDPWTTSKLEILSSRINELWFQTESAPLHLIELFPALRSLHIECAADGFDFGKFASLRECVLANQRAIPASLAHCKQLKSLSISNSKIKTLEPLSNLSSLEKLVLGSVAAPSLAPLGKLSRLKHLGVSRFQESDLNFLAGFNALECCYLFYGPKLMSLGGIESVVTINDLCITNCPNVTDLTPLRQLVDLARLCIESCQSVESLRPLQGHPAVTKVLLWENTKIRDGDLRCILGNPKLVELSFKDRRNYNLTAKEADSVLKKKGKRSTPT